MAAITIELKMALHEKCNQLVDEMIARGQWRIDQVQEAANEESKSSMGDKYETTRSMMQREKEQAEAQLDENLKLKEALYRIHVNALMDTVAPGAAVRTNMGNFFLAAAVGKFTVEGENWFGISAISPLGQKLKGLGKGDTFELNKRKFVIQELA